MQFKRRTLGTVYTKSPSQLVKEWVVTNLSKICFAIIYGIVWMGVFYVITGIINFLWVNLMKNEAWEAKYGSTWAVYTDPKFVWANMIGFVIVIIYCLRDRLTKR